MLTGGSLPGFPGVSPFGLGTTGFWSGYHPGVARCIREAVEVYGLSVIDTAEMYGDGRSETALGEAVRGIPRDRLFITDKILPGNATEKGFRKSLLASLKRLGTDHIDLYLLHWRERADLGFLARAMEDAVREGLIKHWGVSNFDTADLMDLLSVEYGDRCFCDQIFYSVYERGCETRLLSFMKAHGILPMAYSSLGSNYRPHPDIRQNRAVMDLCRETGIAPEAMMLRWVAENGACALFGTSSVSHLRDDLQPVPDEAAEKFREITEREFPAPDHIYPLVKI